ncbi:MAG: ABC transporter ATP-binding protein [Holosporaceae bacterium]|jgi:ABC-2 type transport system ATP-binding protein|nr:ABC transporter ATP-binding protein [Holosporaceae bacterium]
MIEISRLSKYFGNTRALADISLTFQDGILHGIIGPAGAGKTTLLRLMVSLLKKDAGEIAYFLEGKQVQFSQIRQDIAYMPQQQSLYADLSVEEHMKFFASMYGVDKNTYKNLSRRLYGITRLEKFKDRPAGKLSGGMYKKLGLMCVLLRSPKIILLDEPTNGVDPLSRREFWSILNNAVADNVLVIMTTAYMDEAERCGCVHLMENGTVIDAGEPQQLLLRDNVENFDQFFLKRARKNE